MGLPLFSSICPDGAGQGKVGILPDAVPEPTIDLRLEEEEDTIRTRIFKERFSKKLKLLESVRYCQDSIVDPVEGFKEE